MTIKEKEYHYVVLLLIMLFITAAFNIFFPSHFFVYIYSAIVILSIFLARHVFKSDFIDNHKEAFNLLIELVAVFFGVFLATDIQNNVSDNQKRSQLIRTIQAVQKDLEVCSNNFKVEIDTNFPNLYKNDSLFAAMQKRGERYRYPPPQMLDYLVKNNLAIEYFYPDLLRAVVGIAYNRRLMFTIHNRRVFPTLESYESDMKRLMDLLKEDSLILSLQIDYMKKKIDIKEIDDALRERTIRITESFAPIGYEETN